MIRVFAYDEGKFGYECESCGLTFTKDISERITDNCALDVDVICKECGENGVVYFTRCTEEYMAKELLAKILLAKESRRS